jgi:hypothetical protein
MSGTGGSEIFINTGSGSGSSILGNPGASDHGSGTQKTPVGGGRSIINADESGPADDSDEAEQAKRLVGEEEAGDGVP